LPQEGSSIIFTLKINFTVRLHKEMKLVTAFCFTVLAALPLGGQAPASKPAAPPALDACKILANPRLYDGKVVTVRGSYRRQPDWRGIESRDCTDELLVVEPSDPSIKPAANFKIQEDDALRNFKKLIEDRMPPDPDMDAYEAGPRYKYEVVATFTGRLDSANIKLPSGKTFKARLVLKSVSNVVSSRR
jgi:hypothetical protein